jgi:hypothetical protein
VKHLSHDLPDYVDNDPPARRVSSFRQVKVWKGFGGWCWRHPVQPCWKGQICMKSWADAYRKALLHAMECGR